MDGTNKMQFTYKMEYYSDLKKETGIFHNMKENVLSEKNNSVLLHLPLVHTAVKITDAKSRIGDWRRC